MSDLQARDGFSLRWLLLLAAMGIMSCSVLRPRPAPPPPTPPPAPSRVDTVIVTREVPPPLPDGTEVELCLATGYGLKVRLAANGDTLIGDRRVPTRALTGLVIEGSYARSKSWFQKGEQIRFDRRMYRKVDLPAGLKCEDLKQVGENDGVPLFADLMVLSPIETIYVPIAPGQFQPYRTTLPRR
ncbi:MAG: hypothetical protein WEE89_18300 [Gemmatimonadota bacterium]